MQLARIPLKELGLFAIGEQGLNSINSGYNGMILIIA
jgi:hypothetical protein